ncbi:MAG: hypothetical protein E7612_10420 [Ruminococcaceae bacterium]|nr:hypothetical protein [Oscillospiraceae bacterium]
MNTLINYFENYVYHDKIMLESDGYIGIPVDIAVLYNEKRFGTVKPGANGTPIILYVINTAIERVGTAEDKDIILSMLERGYAVLVIDYKNNKKTVSPALDYSVQAIRRRVIEPEKSDVLAVFGDGKFLETFVVPAGYDVELSNPYWAFDKHGADGILEKITEIWNNDFKGTNAERLVKWTDEFGKRKKTVTALDETLPFWCNENGEMCDNGEYIKLKYTYAKDITDCVRPDGSPIDLNLYMHLIYPKCPRKPAPVMCLSSSTEHLANGSAALDRPHLLGFLFRGYVGVMFDYGYTPMARADHYGYFDGYPKKGYVTGDNATYSMSFYNDKRIFTAAMRYIRYLALSDEKFAFDTNAIGVYGNSKGSWMTFLGEENPERLSSKRILAGHHDETRFEAGKRKTVGIIRGGEEQPWLKIGENVIKSEAELIYSSCGGLDDSITEKHCPMFISSNRTDSSCYGTSNAMLAACRVHNVPTMCVDIPLPHTIVYGEDLVYGIDTYRAFYDFCGYYLKGDAIRVVGIKANTVTLPYSVNVRFSGAVSKEEISKISLTDSNGNVVCGEWRGAYGGVDWVFTPTALDYALEYTLIIPENLQGDNGKALGEKVEFKFTSPKTSRTPLRASSKNSGGIEITMPKRFGEGRAYVEFEVLNEGTNRIALSSTSGEDLAFVNVHGKGLYRINVSDIISVLPETVLLSATRDAGSFKVYESDFENSMSGFDPAKRCNASLSTLSCGTSVIEISGFKTVTEHPTEEFYIYPSVALTNDKIAGELPMKNDDMGRSFTVNMRLYDTASRYVKISLNHMTKMDKSITDYRRFIYNVATKAGEWIDVSFDFDVYEFMYTGVEEVQKTLTVSAYGLGNNNAPLYIADVKTYENITSVDFGGAYLVIEEEPKEVLPEGQSDIICKKSPWQK